MNAPLSVIHKQGAAALCLQWPDGTSAELGYALLRSRCPCSQCRARRLRGHIDQAPAGVRLVEVNGQGYGLQLVFDDGHARGIYPWAYLRQLGEGEVGPEAPRARHRATLLTEVGPYSEPGEAN